MSAIEAYSSLFCSDGRHRLNAINVRSWSEAEVISTPNLRPLYPLKADINLEKLNFALLISAFRGKADIIGRL